MELNIDKVVLWEKTPAHYHSVEPFSVTVHFKALTVAERSAIQDAIVNVGHKIRLMRGNDETDAFHWSDGRAQ